MLTEDRFLLLARYHATSRCATSDKQQEHAPSRAQVYNQGEIGTGPTGKSRLAFIKHHTRFANMARGA